MVQAASEHGYPEATVARVVANAGVSRATFYEHFCDKDDCFQAAYREKLEVVRTAVRVAAGTATPRGRARAIVEVLLRELATRPDVARLILVEALGAPEAIRKGHEALIERIDEEIAGFLDTQPREEALQIPATALLGGVGELLATRVLAGPAQAPAQFRDQLMRWIGSYRLPAGEDPLRQARWSELGRFSQVIPREPDDPPALLPRGRSALPSMTAAARRRKRILDATVRLTAREGYASLTVARIAAAAKVPRSAFYSHFDGKQEALLTAQTEGMQGAMAMAAAEYSLPAPWPERVWRAATAFLHYVAEHPDLARLDFVESYSAGRAVTLRRQQSRAVFALFLEDGYRQNAGAADLPRICSEAIGAAIFALMRKLVIEEKTGRMLSILPAASYTILAPFLGPQEAADRVQEWAQEAH